jgi:hypothetical protein
MLYNFSGSTIFYRALIVAYRGITTAFRGSTVTVQYATGAKYAVVDL